MFAFKPIFDRFLSLYFIYLAFSTQFSFWKTKKGAEICSSCSAGFESNPSGSLCLECQEGYFNPSPGQMCAPCGAGNYSYRGAVGCRPCEAGTYNPDSHIGKCLPCGPGFYQPKTGQKFKSSCLDCPKEYYCPFPNTQVPVPCPENHFCLSGSTKAKPCIALFESPAQSDVYFLGFEKTHAHLFCLLFLKTFCVFKKKQISPVHQKSLSMY